MFLIIYDNTKDVLDSLNWLTIFKSNPKTVHTSHATARIAMVMYNIFVFQIAHLLGAFVAMDIYIKTHVCILRYSMKMYIVLTRYHKIHIDDIYIYIFLRELSLLKIYRYSTLVSPHLYFVISIHVS